MIQTKNLQFSFNGQQVIKNLSLDLSGKNFTAVIGPNGSGKTTLLKILCGILQPGAGSVTYSGIAGSAPSPSKNRPLPQQLMWLPSHIEMPFSYPVNDVLTMLLHPWESLKRFATKQAAVTAALTEVGLPDFGQRSFNSLSAGEQHRAVLGAALVSDAEILVLDEPCANLDIGAAHRIMKKLKSAAERGKTIVFSIHDLQIAHLYCEHLLLLTQDHHHAIGSRDDIFSGSEIRTAFAVDIDLIPHGTSTIPVFRDQSPGIVST